MAKYKVKFLPDNKTIVVNSGSTLLEAVEKAGIVINSLCGGEGLCDQCRLQIIDGKTRMDAHDIAVFSREEIQQGYVLACQTKINGDLTVMIPPKSRLELEKIEVESRTIVYSEPEKIALYKGTFEFDTTVTPLIKKYYLELPPPTIQDNISDVDRIVRELKKVSDYEAFEIELNGLQNLAEKLRSSNWKITTTIARCNGVGQILKVERGDTSHQNYGLAIDVGTTTVVVQLINLNTGRVIGVRGSHNLQAHYGEDVISRMVFACVHGSLNLVHKAVITNINKLTRDLAEENHIRMSNINAVVAAGNTTMSHFLLNLMPCSIRLEPYVPTATVYPHICASKVGINIGKHGILEVVPSVASFVGGDIVAGVLACGISDRPEISCLIDVGTNGEIVIGNNEWLVCCSASAGPAFEGSGARSGMRAVKGAIEKLNIVDGKIVYETIGKIKPRGICGSGLIDFIYELVKNEIIGYDGKFNTACRNNRLVRDSEALRYIIARADETDIGEDISISESEIANIIKSKGAVFAAIKSLVDYVGINFTQLDKIYVAGGFGSSLNIDKAIGIGLIPDIDVRRVQFIGNSSLTGARMILNSLAAFDKAKVIARRMTNIELSNYPPFMNEFIAALFLPHTNRTLFPSVKYGPQ